MSKFMPNPSPAFKASVAALLRLPVGERRFAFAEATAPAMQRQDGERGRLVTRGTCSWRRLFGQRGQYGDALPGDDHAELRMGPKPVYVSHPYNLDLRTMRQIVETCDAEGLDCRVSADSSYFPCGTIRLEWRRP